MDNLVYDYVEDSYDEPDYELIGGEKFIMAAAAPNINHLTITSRLSMIFSNYIDEKNINAFVMADADVYLSDKDHYRPDLSIICDLSTVKNGKKVYGVPDLVVEILSESTMKNDIGKKKDAYEECGVKEYWIVDQWSRRIEVYHLIDNKFILDDVYMASNDTENKDVKSEIKVSIFEDMIVDVRNVFKWWISN
ncbi:MAG: Uma2 family endonuclease [Selenomonadaceae bacterium]|nr:Uma2 family endonuclease [Selenomonadaceae bacterium]